MHNSDAIVTPGFSIPAGYVLKADGYVYRADDVDELDPVCGECQIRHRTPWELRVDLTFPAGKTSIPTWEVYQNTDALLARFRKVGFPHSPDHVVDFVRACVEVAPEITAVWRTGASGWPAEYRDHIVTNWPVPYFSDTYFIGDNRGRTVCNVAYVMPDGEHVRFLIKDIWHTHPMRRADLLARAMRRLGGEVPDWRRLRDFILAWDVAEKAGVQE